MVRGWSRDEIAELLGKAEEHGDPKSFKFHSEDYWLMTRSEESQDFMDMETRAEIIRGMGIVAYIFGRSCYLNSHQTPGLLKCLDGKGVVLAHAKQTSGGMQVVEGDVILKTLWQIICE